jgi:RND superfamily putative drug exporter
VFDALATVIYRLRWLILPLGVALLALSYAGKDKALDSLSTHIGGLSDTESGRASTVLSNNLAHGGGDVIVVFAARTLSARGETRDEYARLVREALQPVTAAIAANAAEPPAEMGGRPTRLRTFYENGTPLQVASGDPKVTMALIDLAGTNDQKKRGVVQFVSEPLESHFLTLANTDPAFRDQFGVNGSRRDFRIYVTGGAATSAEAAALTKADSHRADRISLPLTAIMLIVIFGGVIAAIQPLFIGFLAAGVAIVMLGVFNQLFAVSNVAGTVTAVLGLGLSIDYSLLIVTRFREELRRDPQAEMLPLLKRTMNTAGRSVLFSGLAVATGMMSLAFVPLVAFRSLALAGCVTALFAVVGALAILPAVLGIAGHSINRFNVMAIFGRREQQAAGEAGEEEPPGIFRDLARFVVRYPLPIALLSLILLGILAIPAFGMRLGTTDYRILPDDSNVREGYEVLVQAFGTGAAEPIKIAYQEPDLLTPEGIGRLWDYVHNQVMRQPGIATGAGGLPAVESAVSVLDSRLQGMSPEQQKQLYMTVVPAVARLQAPPTTVDLPGVGRLTPDEAQAYISIRDAMIKGDTALVQVSPASDPQSDAARELVRELRDNRPPAPATALVGGTPASTLDYVREITGAVPWVVLFVFVLTYVVLWALLGSVTLPLIAFLLNVVSLGASFGALVYIFQEGHFTGLLEFTKLDVLDATTPVVLFAVTFGLSMDYQVFLLSRIKEEYDRTGTVEGGIVGGLSRTAGIITGAAATLLVVLAAYGTASNALVKSLTVGMFIAVLVDATVVRSFLVPSVLKLVGKPAWYSPPGLYRFWQRLGLAERE